MPKSLSRGCSVLEKQDAWKAVCAGAQTLLASASEAQIASFFELNFDPHQVVNADDSTAGTVTGYYEPLLHGSRTKSSRFRYPLYGVPQDLLVIDLTSVYPDLKGRRLRGRVEGNRVVPYFSRGDIDSDQGPACSFAAAERRPMVARGEALRTPGKWNETVVRPTLRVGRR